MSQCTENDVAAKYAKCKSLPPPKCRLEITINTMKQTTYLQELTPKQKTDIKKLVNSGKATILDVVRIYKEYPKNEILAIFK